MPYKTTRTLPPLPQLRAIVHQEQDRALINSARLLRLKASRYPLQNPDSTYERTGRLQGSFSISAVRRLKRQTSIKVGIRRGRLKYAKWVEFGTGLFGPQKSFIYPRRARFLVWRGKGLRARKWGGVQQLSGIAVHGGRTQHVPRRDEFLFFAHRIKGMPGWHYMKHAIEDPAMQNYFRLQVRQMLQRIGRRLDRYGK